MFKYIITTYKRREVSRLHKKVEGLYVKTYKLSVKLQTHKLTFGSTARADLLRKYSKLRKLCNSLKVKATNIEVQYSL